jgi:hypothetical protein
MPHRKEEKVLLKQKLALLAAANAKIAAAKQKMSVPDAPWDDIVFAHKEYNAAHRALHLMKKKWRESA